MDAMLPSREAESKKARARIFLTLTAVLTGFMLLGLFVDFVPADFLRSSPLIFLLFLAGLGGTVFLVRRARRLGTHREPSRFKRWLGIAALPFLLAFMGWLVLAKGLPWTYTLAFGKPYREHYHMHTEHVHSRKTCDYRLRGGPMEHGFPNYLCIAPEYYALHPDQDVEVELTGQRSALGMQVEEVHGDY